MTTQQIALQTPTSLETLIDQALAEKQRVEKEAAHNTLRKQQECNHRAEERLGELLEQYLLPDFRANVTISYRHFESYGHLHCAAYFPYLSNNWCIEIDNHIDTSTPCLYITEQGKTSPFVNKGRGYSMKWDTLQWVLLTEMGMVRERREQEYIATKEYKRQCLEQEQRRQQERVAREQQEVEEAAQELAARIAEHTVLAIQLAVLRKQAIQTLWVWPTGVTIDLYELEYCRGKTSEADAYDYDYAHGWTATDTLDEQGYIQLEQEYRHLYSWCEEIVSPRRIKLTPSVHHPVWTVHQYRCTDALPEALYQEVTITLPNVVKKCCSDGEYRLTQVASLYNEEESEFKDSIGRRPPVWIQVLVDTLVAAATAAHTDEGKS